MLYKIIISRLIKSHINYTMKYQSKYMHFGIASFMNTKRRMGEAVENVGDTTVR